LSLFYAFKQSDNDAGDDDSTGSPATSPTGWETMLQRLIDARFSVTGTLPMRTERGTRTISLGTNALASSIVLVCRPRPADASRTSRGGFVAALARELAAAVQKLKQGGIVPVDLGQAAIGPGMAVFSRLAVFSRHSAVLEPGDRPMTVRTALQITNEHLDEILSNTEGDYDTDTRWALAWFDANGMKEGRFLGPALPLAEGEEQVGEVAARAGGRPRRGKDRRRVVAALQERADQVLGDLPGRQTRIGARVPLFRQLGAGEEPHLAAAVRDDPRPPQPIDRDRESGRKASPPAGPYNALAVAWPRLAQVAASLPAAPEQGTLV
jgi:putative DNA methylase